MHKLLSELGVQEKIFSAIRSLIFSVTYFSVEPTTDLFPVTQGSGQGKVLAAFMCKVYINEPLKKYLNASFPQQ